MGMWLWCGGVGKRGEGGRDWRGGIGVWGMWRRGWDGGGSRGGDGDVGVFLFAYWFLVKFY